MFYKSNDLGTFFKFPTLLQYTSIRFNVTISSAHATLMRLSPGWLRIACVFYKFCRPPPALGAQALAWQSLHLCQNFPSISSASRSCCRNVRSWTSQHDIVARLRDVGNFVLRIDFFCVTWFRLQKRVAFRIDQEDRSICNTDRGSQRSSESWGSLASSK